MVQTDMATYLQEFEAQVEKHNSLETLYAMRAGPHAKLAASVKHLEAHAVFHADIDGVRAEIEDVRSQHDATRSALIKEMIELEERCSS